MDNVHHVKVQWGKQASKGNIDWVLFNRKCVGKAFTKLYILGARGKIYANVTIDVAFAIFLWRKFPFCCYCSISEKKFANKVCCFIWPIKAVQNIEIHINSVWFISYNCSSAKLLVLKLNNLGKLALNQHVYIITPNLANTLTRHCFGLVIDAKLSSTTSKSVSWLQALSFA